jgi:hypothetical protein
MQNTATLEAFGHFINSGKYGQENDFPIVKGRNSFSVGYARKVTEDTVRKIADHQTRSLVRQFLEPKIVTDYSAGSQRASTETETTKSDWLRFAKASIVEYRPTRIGRGLRSFHDVGLDLPSFEIDMFKTDELSAGNSANVGAIGFEMLESFGQNVDANASSEQFLETSGFVPSKELIEAWGKGINSNLREANLAVIPVRSLTSDPEYAKSLSREIRKVISSFAKRKAYEGGNYRITFGKRLLPTVQNLLVDHLMLPPLDAVDFLNIFMDLIYQQSVDTPVFSGRWGELVIDDAGELLLVLVKRKRRSLATILKG